MILRAGWKYRIEREITSHNKVRCFFVEFFADWHTHTWYSDGRGTIEENILAAIDRGLEEVGITDHGPGNIRVGVRNADTYKQIQEEVKSFNDRFREINVKAGAEADIVDVDGTIDIPSKVAQDLDLLIVGLHPYIWPATLRAAWSVVGLNQLAQLSRSVREKVRVINTKALEEALFRYDVDFISHPDLKMPVDIPELAAACAGQGTAIEINTGHQYDKEELVRIAAKKGVDFVVSSDAHFPATVGELADGGVLLEKFKVPVERIINARTT